MNAKQLNKTLEETTGKTKSVIEIMDDKKMTEIEEELKNEDNGKQFQPIDPALETIKEIVNILRDTKDIDTITEFKRPQVILFQQVELLGVHFNIPILNAFCRGIKEKNISIDRGSRTELLRAIERVQPSMPDIGGMGQDTDFPLSYGKNMKG